MRIQFVLLLITMFCSTTLAQIVVQPDADLWGGGVTNPSGLAAIPILQYDPSNGEMWIHTVGLNGVSESGSYGPGGMVEGDDVGMASISVVSPPAIATAPEFVGFVNGVPWTGQYFNGKQQLFAQGAGAPYLAPTAGLRVWTFDAGLTPDDFGIVEMAVNFGSGIPGTVMFGEVQFVPEPSGFLVSLSLVLGQFLIRRKLK